MKLIIDYKAKTAEVVNPMDTAPSQEVINTMVNRATIQVNTDIVANNELLMSAKMDLDKLKHSYPIDPIAIIKKQMDIESIEDVLDRLKKLREELGFKSLD